MEQQIKLIALDMDGVVNSDQLIQKWLLQKEKELKKIYRGDQLRLNLRKEFNKEFSNSTELIFPIFAERITKICNETNCYILWTSTWRKIEKYQDIKVAIDMFNRNGLPGDKLIGYTKGIGIRGNCRGSQIAAWLRQNKQYNVIKCAVIDDRVDAGYNLPENAKYFNTNPYIGIQEYNVQDIINYLND